MFDSLIVAFSTYSRIPMPQVEWTEKSMKHAICYFPLIGLCIGLLFLGWAWLSELLALNPLLRAAGLTVIPILVSGGIHMDGFCDTVDALSSHQSRERMLDILKDSNSGAFAVVFCGVWLLTDAAALSGVTAPRALLVLALGFVLSRALSGLAIANWKGARPSGMLQTFADTAHRSVVTRTMSAYIVLSAVGMLLLSPLAGVAALLCAGLVFLYYRLFSYRRFGGITGDLAGYFLELCELAMALALALVGRWL